jgi:hypothetical protein
MVKGTPIDALLLPLGMLAVLGLAVLGLSIARFRRDLAPAGQRRRPDDADADAGAGAAKAGTGAR